MEPGYIECPYCGETQIMPTGVSGTECDDCGEWIDDPDWEPEHEEPHERHEREAESYARQEVDRIGPDYWRDPDSGETRIG
jgi:ribosomal protein L37AE/L43A